MIKIMKNLFFLFTSVFLFSSWLQAAELPTGMLKATGFIVEKGQFRMTEKDLYKHDASVTIKSLGSDKYSFHISASLQKTSGSPPKNDVRNDIYVVKWTSDKSGVLLNADPKYSGDKSSFEISKDQLIIKSWIDRHQSWETHIYLLTE